MKFFAFIFSFYLLGLSFVPCGDKEECKLTSASTISSATNHQKHSQDTENCPPICHCSCCATSAFFQPVAVFNAVKRTILPVKYSVFNVSVKSTVSFSVWQPPKLD